MNQPEFKYDAFISYRRSDGAGIANWLRRELENFSLPKNLRQRFGRKLKVYIDTTYERGTSDFYEQTIRPALLNSRYLLVVATPDATKRADDAEDWIRREVCDFCNDSVRAKNVIVVRGLGEFNAPLPADLKERFPNIEIVDLRGGGRFSFLLPARATRLSSEKLKLIAPLLDIPPEEMPLLRQEEERQQQVRLGRTAGVVLGILTAVSLLSVYAFQSRNAAQRSLEDSMFAIGRMVLMAKDLKLPRNDENDDPRAMLVNVGCDLIDKLSVNAIAEPLIKELVTCRLERAAGREGLGETAEAEKMITDAVNIASQRYGRTHDSDAAQALINARNVFAQYFVRRKDMARAESEYEKLISDADQFGKAHEGKSDVFINAAAMAGEETANLFVEQGRRVKASEKYLAAAERVYLLFGKEASENNEATASWLAQLCVKSAEQLKETDDPTANIRCLEQAQASRSKLPKDATPEIDQSLAAANAMISIIKTRQGDFAKAKALQLAALEGISHVLISTKSTPELKKQAAGLREFMEKLDETTR